MKQTNEVSDNILSCFYGMALLDQEETCLTFAKSSGFEGLREHIKLKFEKKAPSLYFTASSLCI